MHELTKTIKLNWNIESFCNYNDQNINSNNVEDFQIKLIFRIELSNLKKFNNF